LTVASITGAKNLITTGFVAIFYPPQNNADIAQHITDLRSQGDKSQELDFIRPAIVSQTNHYVNLPLSFDSESLRTFFSSHPILSTSLMSNSGI
jgi:hypothetical protein